MGLLHCLVASQHLTVPPSSSPSAMSCILPAIVALLAVQAAVSQPHERTCAIPQAPPLADTRSICKDDNENCQHWADVSKYCSNSEFSPFMADHCPASCNMCPGGSAACEDNSPTCPIMASEGKCESDKDFTEKNCKRSCFICRPSSSNLFAHSSVVELTDDNFD